MNWELRQRNKKKEFVKRKIKELLQMKLSLENKFLPELKRYFRDCSLKLRQGEFDFDSIKNQLRDQHNRIVKTLMQGKKKNIDFIKIINSLENINDHRIDKDSGKIDKTTMEKIKQSLEMARQQLKDSGINHPMPDQINKLAGRIFDNYNKGRIQSIMITTTNTYIEKSRREIIKVTEPDLRSAVLDDDIDEIQYLNDLRDDWESEDILDTYESDEFDSDDDRRRHIFSSMQGAVKIWATMGDDRVRDWHAEADGQTQNIDDPFEVMGELLMEPGDDSLGASPKNICNCRCSSII